MPSVLLVELVSVLSHHWTSYDDLNRLQSTLIEQVCPQYFTLELPKQGSKLPKTVNLNENSQPRTRRDHQTSLLISSNTHATERTAARRVRWKVPSEM